MIRRNFLKTAGAGSLGLAGTASLSALNSQNDQRLAQNNIQLLSAHPAVLFAASELDGTTICGDHLRPD